jgi:SAM-dependent methyltransferase
MKPRHLESDYAAQFRDSGVATAYAARPPYPDSLFDALLELIPATSRRVLELGAGTGDVTIGLAARVDQIDAVEPSSAMLQIARQRGHGAANVAWFPMMAEQFDYIARYDLAVAAESLHWMDWSLVLPKIAGTLAPSATLAIVTSRDLIGLPWADELHRLIATFSTNHDYRSYDLVHELTSRGLFEEAGRRTLSGGPFTQSLGDYVESFHSRNGFSRERMGAQRAAGFDRVLCELVRRHGRDERVSGAISTTLVWGAPKR